LTDLDADLSLLFFFGFLFCHTAFTGMSVHVQYAGSDVGRESGYLAKPEVHNASYMTAEKTSKYR
jgi:hypothetical protein